ncbi:glycosyltransferase family 2 protein [Algibacter mikhailovii]|uniref:glycosyltransferase family 2 protein n=1 Tax=Algibacter mikhailovii TaxID=425498 RepID=UPI00249509F3|nr:glycosyltransferase family 2 protein [Algibacter mikhailovii]
MDSLKLISIIIPTYNRAHLIGETLDSILTQTYTNWECIVVDDGSTDHTGQVLSQYCNQDQRIKYYHRPKKLKSGGNAARNFGFQKSQGEYINWFDDDDLMHKCFLETKIAQFDARCDFVLTLGTLNKQVDLEQKIKIITRHVDCLFRDYILCKFQIITSNVIFRRRFLNNKNLFSEVILRGQETELFSRFFFRAKHNSYKVVDAPLAFYRQHEDTKSHQSKKYNSNIKRSQASIYFINLERSIALEDPELVKYCLTLVIDTFFSTIKNKDRRLSKWVLKELYAIAYKINRVKALKSYVLGTLIIVSGSYKFRVKNVFKKALRFIYC